MIDFKLTDGIQRKGIEALVGNINDDGSLIFMVYENIIKPNEDIVEGELFKNNNGKLESIDKIYIDYFFKYVTEKNTGLITLGYASNDFKYYVLVELAPDFNGIYLLRYRTLTLCNYKFIDYNNYIIRNVSNLYATMSPIVDNRFIALYQNHDAGDGYIDFVEINNPYKLIKRKIYKKINVRASFTSNNMYIVKFKGNIYLIYTYEWTELIDLTAFGKSLYSYLIISDLDFNELISVPLTSPSLGMALYIKKSLRIVTVNQGVVIGGVPYIYRSGMEYYITLSKNNSVNNIVLYKFDGCKLKKLNSYRLFTAFSTSGNMFNNMFMLSVAPQNQQSKALDSNGLTYLQCYIKKNKLKLSMNLNGLLGTGGYSFFPLFSKNKKWFICGCTSLNFDKKHNPINNNVQLYSVITR